MFKIKIGRHIIDDEINEFIKRNRDIRSQEFLKLMNTKYKQALTQAAINNEYIRTSGMEQSGKTIAMAEFCKENGYHMVVGSYGKAKELREKVGYRHIYCRRSYGNFEIMVNKYVVDDDVISNKIISFRYPVITGFIRMGFSDEQIERINRRIT